MTIIISDLEGTLTTGGLWEGLQAYHIYKGDRKSILRLKRAVFLKYIAKRLGVYGERAFNDSFLIKYSEILRGKNIAEVNEMAYWIVENVLWPKRTPLAYFLMSRLQSQDTLVICSAAYSPIVEAFSHKMKAKSLGSPFIQEGSILVGGLEYVNSAKRKEDSAENFLKGMDIGYSFSDSADDVGFLGLAKTSIAVNASTSLKNVARQRNWMILNFDDICNGKLAEIFYKDYR